MEILKEWKRERREESDNCTEKGYRMKTKQRKKDC